MPGYKRTTKAYKKTNKRYVKKAAKLSKPTYRAVKSIVQKQLNKVVETKKAVWSGDNYRQLQNNRLLIIDDTVLYTTQGTADPRNTDNQNRIGDKVLCKGVSFKMMLELNERFGDVTVRVMLIKYRRGDAPTMGTLFCEQAVNKQLDQVNTERFTILHQKYTKLRMGNRVIDAAQLVNTNSFGQNYDLTANAHVITRPTKILKFWVPGTKFGSKGILTYDSGSNDTKFFDYAIVVIPYADYAVPIDAANAPFICAVNEYVRIHYFQDA